MIDSFCCIIGSFFEFVIGSLKSEIAPFFFLFFPSASTNVTELLDNYSYFLCGNCNFWGVLKIQNGLVFFFWEFEFFWGFKNSKWISIILFGNFSFFGVF
jgi:hypothetical protein